MTDENKNNPIQFNIKLDDSIQFIDAEDITAQDLEKLRNQMTASLVVLNKALYSQAGHEYERIKMLRDLTSELETQLFNPQAMAQMTPREKVYLYQLSLRNMESSLRFLQELNRNVGSSIETLNSVEKLANDLQAKKVAQEATGKKDSNIDPELVKSARVKILQELSKRSKK